MRHLHPQEAGLLNTLPLTFRHPADLRAALSMVGQLAAPLQAAWIFAHVLQCAELVLDGQSHIAPLQVVHDFKKELLQQRDAMWLFEPCASVQQVRLQVSGEPLQLNVQARSTAADILHAESRWASPVQTLTLAIADVPVPAQALLSSVLAQQPGALFAASCACPAQSDAYICVFVRDESAVVQHWCKPGTFAFDLLPADPSPARGSCVNGLTGDLLPIDSRLWSEAFLDSRRRQSGPGVSAGVVWKALQHFAQGVSTCQLLHPLATSALILQAEQGALAQAVAFSLELRSAQLLAVFAHDGHWGCLHLQAVCGAWRATYYDCTPDRLWTSALMLTEALAYLSDLPALPLQQERLFLPALGEACAFDALRHAVALLRSTAELSDVEVHNLRRLLRTPGAADVLYGSAGLSEDQATALQDLLRSHGVPEDKLADRVQQAVARIGAPSLAEALKHKNPWPSLKAVASRPGMSMRWILPTELEAHIAHRANAKFGTTVPHAKSKKQSVDRKRAKQQLLSVDPASLQLAPCSFVASDGAPVAQLAFHEVTAQARGVAFCTAQQLYPFTTHYQALSVEALGLIATSEVRPEACSGAPISSVRFPAIYGPTGEGVLLTGTLLQLGDASIQLASEDMMDLEVLDTRVCRVMVYQDEFTRAWTEFCQAPIRSLLTLLPELTLCQDSRCRRDSGCRKFHPAVEEQVESVVLDVWNRQFQKAEGGKAEPSLASLFSALLRIPASALPPLLRAAQAGVYFEPRSAGGGTDPEYAVIWLPGQDLASARHTLQTCDRAVSLVRLGRKFGVRVRECDEKATFERLRPSQTFIKIQITAKYSLFPLPFGMQRAGVIQLLQKWKWHARPLQPGRGDATGACWEIGASCEPPAATMPLGDGFVLITKLKDLSAAARPPVLCATRKTRQHILYDDGEGPGEPDPWSNGKDPWSLGQQSASSAPPGLAPAASSKLEQVAADLKQDVQHMIRAELNASASSSTDDVTQRIQRLEVGLQEVQAQGQKFEGWFQTFGGQVVQQALEIKDVSQALATQQQDLAKTRSEVQATVSHAVSGLQQSFSTQLASQFQQIEALFNKKARVE